MKTRMMAALAFGLVFGCAKADETPPPATEPAAMSAAPAPGSPEAKIADAMSAAPKSISDHATILELPATEGSQPNQLRAGTNGWTCFASSPMAVTASDKDPICLDDSWMSFFEAYMKHEAPKITHIGIAYMLQGDAGTSLTDPSATAATPDNQWVESGPHLMIIMPNARTLEGYPTDPKSGLPYVMWSGTPYAHIMVPVSDTM
jgi:hypothetical protein